MDEFYKELYVIYFRKWIFQKQNKACKVYTDPSNQDILLLENEYSLGRVTFNKHLIIKLSIQNKWDWIPYTLPNEKLKSYT